MQIPQGFFDMSEDEQDAAAVGMWRVAMVQLGKDPATGEKDDNFGG